MLLLWPLDAECQQRWLLAPFNNLFLSGFSIAGASPVQPQPPHPLSWPLRHCSAVQRAHCPPLSAFLTLSTGPESRPRAVPCEHLVALSLYNLLRRLAARYLVCNVPWVRAIRYPIPYRRGLLVALELRLAQTLPKLVPYPRPPTTLSNA